MKRRDLIKSLGLGCTWLALGGRPSASAAQVQITLGAASGDSIWPLLGVNAGPQPAGEPGNAELTQAYQQAGVQTVRTHDFYGPLDMATMYPDQQADPTQAASYDFQASDEKYAAIVAGGFEPYLRLGDSWNNAPGYPPAHPRAPQRPDHWVQAAVEVVGHYNDPLRWGADPLRSVEIWNEPDGRKFWDADREAFFSLFSETATALKAAYPTLEVGGPGFTPAGAKTAQGQQFVKALLAYLRDHEAPLDFLSWHMYSNDPSDYGTAAAFYRRALDEAGYTQTPTHITEWNTDTRQGGADAATALRQGAQGASLLSAAWIQLQLNDVRKSLFYRGNDPALDAPNWYGLFYADGTPKTSALAFSLWAELSRHTRALEIKGGNIAGALYTLAGSDGQGQVGIFVVNPSPEAVGWELAFEGGPEPSGAMRATSLGQDGLQQLEQASAEFSLPPYGVHYIQYESPQASH